MADRLDGEVKEGFICPTCLQSLAGPAQLLAHFQDQHGDQQDVLRSLKDLFGKAKKKIGLSQEEQSFESSSLTYRSPPVVWDPQEIGASRSLTSSLRVLRNARLERYCADTNKLLIRLNKLLVDVPGDAAKRRAYEQTIVPWIEGAEVKLCPSCAKGFHVARRQHHCRLCGAIMCKDCSYFLSLVDARRMTAPMRQNEKPHTDSSSSESDLRLCHPCHQSLSRREQLKESKTLRPIICQFYDNLQTKRSEALSELEQYLDMCSSLNRGESLFHLSDAQYSRVKLIKLAEDIDSTSKNILVLGTKGDAANAPKGRALRLQQAIRSSATTFLRDQLMGLPSLPTEAQLKELRDKHQRTFESSRAATSSTPRPPQVVANSGWGPASTSKLLLDSDDIMVQQMNILKSYIKQAREANKIEEVKILEDNLRELQEEYWRQQQQQQ